MKSQQFTGVSKSGNFQEALTIAIATAKSSIASDHIEYTVENISGRDGGFVLETVMEVMNGGRVMAMAYQERVVTDELRIKVNPVESIDGFERALRRFWALLYWIFDQSAAVKLLLLT